MGSFGGLMLLLHTPAWEVNKNFDKFKFQAYPPRRSLFAERMICIFHENNPQDRLQNQDQEDHCDGTGQFQK